MGTVGEEVAILSLRNLPGGLLALILAGTTQLTCGAFQPPDPPKRETVGSAKEPRTSETKTDHAGVFTMHLKPGNYRIAEFKSVVVAVAAPN